MGKSLEHNSTPDQYSTYGPLTGLATGDFTLASGDQFRNFNVINENTDPVTLEVKFAAMTTFQACVFQVGPNPYLIKAVKANAVLTAPQIALLKYGY
jgi:hypothetical protein